MSDKNDKNIELTTDLGYITLMSLFKPKSGDYSDETKEKIRNIIDKYNLKGEKRKTIIKHFKLERERRKNYDLFN